MATRYLIAILLPPKLERTVRAVYQQIFGEPCKVRTLHITFLPPFTVDNPDILDDIHTTLSALPESSVTFEFGEPDIFKQPGRRVLYLPVEPIGPLNEIYQKLLLAFRTKLMFETTGFKKNEIPEFLPHITVSYNFKGRLQAMPFPHEPMTLPKPILLIEAGPGIWQPTERHKL